MFAEGVEETPEIRALVSLFAHVLVANFTVDVLSALSKIALTETHSELDDDRELSILSHSTVDHQG